MSYLMEVLAIYYLPLVVSSSVLMSSTFVIMIMGYLVADEKLSKREVVTIICGLMGVIILLNPEWFNIGYSED